MHTMGDAAIVFTPGGNYILAVYLWQKDQLLYDPSNALIAQISRAVYNYFNQASP